MDYFMQKLSENPNALFGLAILIAVGIFIIIIIILSILGVIFTRKHLKKMKEKRRDWRYYDFKNPDGTQEEEIDPEKIMQCPHCKRDSRYGHGFCQNCGGALKKTE